MEYAKLFYNEWYKREHIDQRKEFRIFLNKQWWANASDFEKAQEYAKMQREYESKQRAKQALAFASAYTTLGCYNNDIKTTNTSKYWHGETWKK